MENKPNKLDRLDRLITAIVIGAIVIPLLFCV